MSSPLKAGNIDTTLVSTQIRQAAVVQSAEIIEEIIISVENTKAGMTGNICNLLLILRKF